MAVIEQAFAVVKIDKAAGTLVDISAQVQTCKLGVDANGQNYYTLGENYALAADGKKKWTVNMTCIVTDGGSETEAFDIFNTWFLSTNQPGARTIQLDTPDSSVGSFRFSGEVKCTAVSDIVNVDAAGGNVQVFTVTLMGDGTLTKSTIAS